MKIGEIAARSGLAASRIRFYEASGLIGPAKRGANGYREFPADVLSVLELILCSQEAGFTLEEIRSFLPLPDRPTARRPKLLASLKHKVDEITALQERLTRTKSQLLLVIDGIESHPPGPECSARMEQVLTNIRRARS